MLYICTPAVYICINIPGIVHVCTAAVCVVCTPETRPNLYSVVPSTAAVNVRAGSSDRGLWSDIHIMGTGITQFLYL